MGALRVPGGCPHLAQTGQVRMEGERVPPRPGTASPGCSARAALLCRAGRGTHLSGPRPSSGRGERGGLDRCPLGSRAGKGGPGASARARESPGLESAPGHSGRGWGAGGCRGRARAGLTGPPRVRREAPRAGAAHLQGRVRPDQVPGGLRQPHSPPLDQQRHRGGGGRPGSAPPPPSGRPAAPAPPRGPPGSVVRGARAAPEGEEM